MLKLIFIDDCMLYNDTFLLLSTNQEMKSYSKLGTNSAQFCSLKCLYLEGNVLSNHECLLCYVSVCLQLCAELFFHSHGLITIPNRTAFQDYHLHFEIVPVVMRLCLDLFLQSHN